MKNIYMVGIKGVGMTAMAVYLKEKGEHVFGTDVEEEYPTDEILKENDIEVSKGFLDEHINGVIDEVITSGAHGGLHNVEVKAAEKKGIPVFTHAAKLGELVGAHTNRIAVCGAHGKTTTSSMLAYVLAELNVQSSHFIGAPQFSGLFGGHFGGNDYCVVEADEYVNSPGVDNTPRFMFLDPTVIVCTNIDFDHPDVYESLDAVKQAYKKFFQKLENKPERVLVYNNDDPVLCALVEELPHVNKISYGFSGSSDVVMTHDGTKFSFRISESNEIQGKLAVFGKHNISNAGAVLAALQHLGIDVQKAAEILETYTGASRRMQKIAQHNDTILYDDYAHHPEEIKAVIAGVKELYPRRRCVFLFQPHTFSRTERMEDEFITALKEADEALVLDIFGSARESDRHTISAESLVLRAHEKGFRNIHFVSSSEFDDKLRALLQPGDIIITAGAGDIYRHHEAIIDIIHTLIPS